MAQKNIFPALVLFACMGLLASVAHADAVLTQLSGAVEVGRGEPVVWTAAKSGDAVAPHERVRTGADGRVEIKMDAGTLRVHENSMLRLPPPVNDADQVELDQGRSLFDVLRRNGRRFEVHTPTVVVSVKGTRFGVDAGREIGEVTVYRGTVGVREIGAATDALETLVREGFLATGGVGVPVELDVSTAEDPWQSWQAFGSAQGESQTRARRLGELGRAKARLHRRTDADVIVKAAQRRPEIARRLEELEKSRKNKTGEPSETDALPAAPDLNGEPDATDRREQLKTHLTREARMMHLERLRSEALEAKEVIDAARANGELESGANETIDDLSNSSGLSGGGLDLDFAAVYELSPDSLLLVRESLLELQAEYQDGTFVPTSPTDLFSELGDQLIEKGMSPTDALRTIQALTGN